MSSADSDTGTGGDDGVSRLLIGGIGLLLVIMLVLIIGTTFAFVLTDGTDVDNSSTSFADSESN